MILDAASAPKTGAPVTISLCCHDQDGGQAPSRPDLEIPVCGVPEWDRVLGLYSRRLRPRLVASPVEAAHYRHGHLTYPLRQVLHADELHKKPHKKVI